MGELKFDDYVKGLAREVNIEMMLWRMEELVKKALEYSEKCDVAALTYVKEIGELEGRIEDLTNYLERKGLIELAVGIAVRDAVGRMRNETLKTIVKILNENCKCKLKE